MGHVLASNILESVKIILESQPSSRDNDHWIITTIWDAECQKLKINSLSEFLVAYFNGKLTNHDSVTRARRALQEKYEHLRGKNYEKRQGKLQEETIEDVIKFKK